MLSTGNLPSGKIRETGRGYGDEKKSEIGSDLRLSEETTHLQGILHPKEETLLPPL